VTLGGVRSRLIDTPPLKGLSTLPTTSVARLSRVYVPSVAGTAHE
jgi:hypothetical protein